MSLADTALAASNESTDDASEDGDTVGKGGSQTIGDDAPLKDMVYRDRLEALKRELQELETGTHKDFLEGVAKLENKRENRIAKLELTRELELEGLWKDYEDEIVANKNYFEKQKVELKERLELVIDLETKSLDEERKLPFRLGSSSSSEVKMKIPKERERRRRGSSSGTRRSRPDVRYKIQLEDKDIEADLQIVQKGLHQEGLD